MSIRATWLGLAIAIVSSAAHADDAQAALATQIEALSVVHKDLAVPDNADPAPYQPPLSKRYIEVDGCEFTLFDTGLIHEVEYYRAHVTFDVAQAIFPNPDAPPNDFYMFLPPDGDNEFLSAMVVFVVQFREGYRPTLYVLENGVARTESLDLVNYFMSNQQTEGRVKDLLAAIDTYQKNYCSFVG